MQHLDDVPYVRQVSADEGEFRVEAARIVAQRQRQMRMIEAGIKSASCQEVALTLMKQQAKRPALYTYAGPEHMFACLDVFRWSHRRPDGYFPLSGTNHRHWPLKERGRFLHDYTRQLVLQCCL
jgi:hypothetical protein